MPFSYYRRLSARQRRIYDKSDAVTRVEVPQPERLRRDVDAVAAALRQENRRATEEAAGALGAALLSALKVSGVRVRVLAARPSHDWGELHGLYEPDSGKRPLITVWMRTAQRKQVVAFKTFLRTLLHELMHHLDYELLELDDSYHTQGFYKRESSLFRQLVPDPSRYEAKSTTRGVSGDRAGASRTARVARGERAARAATERAARRKKAPAGAEQTKLPFDV